MSYRPVKDGIEKKTKQVTYKEVEPPPHLQGLVHCYWQLRTKRALSEDFFYHIIPDACVNLLFDQKNIKIAAITAINTSSKSLNLGKEFHYIGVQLLPGVWRGDPREIKGDLFIKSFTL